MKKAAKKKPAKRARRRRRGGAKARTPREALLAELSSRLGLGTRRLEIALDAAESLEEPELRVVEKLVGLAATTPRPLAARQELAASVCEEIGRFWAGEAAADPLAEVDEPLAEGEAFASSLWAEMRARRNRARLLEQCVSAREAGELTHRSRQAVERQRTRGALLALRAGREWRYPRWQFDPDGPAGLVPGLTAVLRHLHLSPLGAALWLTTPKAQLGDKRPVDLLHRRRAERVVSLAEEHGHMP